MVASIKRHRLLRGWSQSRLARESGVSQTYISELEAGKWTPNISVLRKLAAALGVPLTALLDEEVEKGDDDHLQECIGGFKAWAYGCGRSGC